MAWIADPQIWIALLTLTTLEIVLGIDNIIFIAIIAGRLPAHQQKKGRTIGLMMAMVTRIGLLFSLTIIMGLTAPLLTVFGQEISGRDLILFLGGLFLLGKSTLEIHANLEGEVGHTADKAGKIEASFISVITQILLLDVVFSLDSVITAIGLVDQIAVMVAAIIIAVIFMIFLAGPVSQFIENHPTVKILALSFLLLIGVALVAESFDLHIPKGYIYFAMAFSVFVEMLNLKLRKRQRPPVKLRRSAVEAVDQKDGPPNPET
jgi:predicted tellurium resistance membrane protein TerC